MGAGKVTIYPAHKVATEAAEAVKRSARTPVKQTPNVRPRARARTEEWSDLQSDQDDVVSGGSSAVTSGQSSECSSRVLLGTRSGRTRMCASMSGEGTNRRPRRSLPACGLEKYGSTAGWAMGREGPCENCGGGVIHTTAFGFCFFLYPVPIVHRFQVGSYVSAGTGCYLRCPWNHDTEASQAWVGATGEGNKIYSLHVFTLCHPFLHLC